MRIGVSVWHRVCSVLLSALSRTLVASPSKCACACSFVTTRQPVEVTALAKVLDERHRLSLQHGGDRNNPQHFVRADEKHPHRLQVDHGIVQDNCASSTNNRLFQAPPVHVARAAGSMVVVVRESHQGHQNHAPIAHFKFFFSAQKADAPGARERWGTKSQKRTRPSSPSSKRR